VGGVGSDMGVSDMRGDIVEAAFLLSLAIGSLGVCIYFGLSNVDLDVICKVEGACVIEKD